MMNIIMGNEINDAKSLDHMEHEYTVLSNGLKSMAVNLPGFAYHRALKVRIPNLNKMLFLCVSIS